jgi:hypothetical protein
MRRINNPDRLLLLLYDDYRNSAGISLDQGGEGYLQGTASNVRPANKAGHHTRCAFGAAREQQGPKGENQ